MAEQFTRDDLLGAVVAQFGPFSPHADIIRTMLTQIERLRAAGDALHKALNDNIMWSGLDQINAAWEEARRG